MAKRRTKKQVEELALQLWEDYCNHVPSTNTQTRLNVSEGYYYKLLGQISEKMKVDYSRALSRILMKTVAQKEANYRRALANYGEAKEALRKDDGKDLKKGMLLEEKSIKWMREARAQQDSLSDFLMRSGLIPSAQQNTVNVNTAIAVKSPFDTKLEAITDIVQARRARGGSGDPSGSEGRVTVE